MLSLDDLLYKWISRANEHLEEFALPIGLVEDSIALIVRVLGIAGRGTKPVST